MKFFLIVFCSMLLLLHFSGCGVAAKDDPGLHYKGEDPLVLFTTDSSHTLVFKKVAVVDARGSLKTTDNYDDVTLRLSKPKDSSFVQISNLSVKGIKPTDDLVHILATDNQNVNLTDEFDVTVKDP